MLPISAFRMKRFADAKVGDFVQTSDNDGPYIIGTTDELNTVAVFLEGRFAGKAIPIEPTQPRWGLAIDRLSIEVDPKSWTSDDRAIGAVVAGPDAAIIRAEMRTGAFEDGVKVRISADLGGKAIEDGAAAFRRWALVYRSESGERIVLWERGGE